MDGTEGGERPEAALFEALQKGEAERVAELLREHPGWVDARNDEGDTPLLVAVYAGRRDLSDLLLRAGAGIDVFEAAAAGLTGRVAELLDEDPSRARAYSHDGWTPLHLASFFGHREVAALLLERGAAIDARSRSRRFARENTPLHAAAANRQTAVAELLLERGADVNARDGSGFTPLGLAANSRNDLLILMLLERGASVA
jgi:ankyrin repeat protein